jgi:hypothetical protein
MRGSVEFGAVCSAGGLLLAPLATGAAAGQTLSDEHRDGHALARNSLKHDRLSVFVSVFLYPTGKCQ